MGLLQRFRDRLSESPQRLRAQEVRAICAELAGIQQIGESRPRTKPRVAGVVQSMKMVPHENTTLLEVDIYDGTDEITGVWYGRSEIPGITLGRPLILEGTIRRGDDGRLQMINPAYHLVPAD